jgi:hypothetical protein
MRRPALPSLSLARAAGVTGPAPRANRRTEPATPAR